jgi:poly(3-hydroxybutyrate) depolymerase
VQEFIRHIGPEVHVISVCQPTVPVLAAVSLLASHGEFTPRTMTMMGGPIDARKPHRGEQPGDEQEPRVVREQRDLPRAEQLPGAGRRVYPGFLQHTGFVAMNPDRHMTPRTTTTSST